MRQPGLPLPELAVGSGHSEGHLVHLVEVQQNATFSVAQIQTVFHMPRIGGRIAEDISRTQQIHEEEGMTKHVY